MNTDIEQLDDDKKRLLEITAALFLQNSAKCLKSAIEEHPAGFTFNIIDLHLKTNFSSEIYLVGQRKHGKNFKTTPNLSELHTWLCKNLSAIYERGGLIGGWWNKNDIFLLDVVTTIDGRENAMVAGMVNGEKEIYHPYSNRSLKVNTPQINIHLLEES